MTNSFLTSIFLFCGIISSVIQAQDFPPNPHEKPGYVIDFNDEFDGSILDTSKWVPYYLPQWSSKQNSATNYKLVDNKLILKIDRNQKPWCPEFNGQVKVSSLQTGLYSGDLNSDIGQHKISADCRVREEQSTQRLYTPRYGYFEIRAKAISSKNNVCAFWMIGFEDEPHKSGEICIMEIKGHNVQNKTSVNGYGVRAFNDPSLLDEFFEDASDFNASNYHIYAAEWKPDGIDFYLDNRLVYSSSQSPDYEMQFMLNIYEVPTDKQLEESDLQYPKFFEIDYIRAYKPKDGY